MGEDGLAWPLGRPRWLLGVSQSAFAALYGWKVWESALAGPNPAWWVWAAVLLAGLLAGGSYVVPWDSLPRWLPIVLILVDIALVGVAAQGAPGASVVIVLVPAVMSAMLFGSRSISLLVAGVILAVTVPTLFGPRSSRVDLARAFVTPLSALAIAVATGRTRRQFIDRQRTIYRQQQINEAVFDAVDVGLLVMEPGGLISLTNRKFRYLESLVYPTGPPGRSAEDRVLLGDGQTPNVFLADGNTPMPTQDYPSQRCLRGEEFDDVVLWCGLPPNRRAVSVSSRVVWDEEGLFNGSVLACSDVTRLMPDTGVG